VHLVRSLFYLTFFLFFSTKGKAQQDPFLSASDALMSLKSKRLQKNTQLKATGRQLTWEQFLSIKPDQIQAFDAGFTADSISWVFTVDDHTIALSFPNDIALVLGLDRAALQEKLLEQFRKEGARHQFTAEKSAIKPDSLCDTIWIKSNTRYGFLNGLQALTPRDSLPVCCMRYPVASAVSAINDTADCDGLFPVVLVHNRYGNKRDTVLTTLPDLMRISEATRWTKWFTRDSEGLLVLLQHPYLGFDHMLYLKPEVQNGSSYWHAELHAYIPSHNVRNLYGTHKQKKGAERFVIK
jgi:hypothetical protein